MKRLLKELCGLLPANAQTSQVLEPADGTFHGPMLYVAAEGTSILGTVFRFAIAAVGRDHLAPFVDPPLKPTIHRAFGAESGRKIRPFGPVVEGPEDALNDLSFVG